ncbi:conserved hypothetical protein [Methylocella silvestris BL2]|uniref:DUF1993 domain-containing protein n=1 Tax=Methylocella silvestris (strain DSM 15510 / CIP 108128 / LMG 27833 / NCIMB 13906 / BL2) TaxID=395965 RepID=B8ES48_METSB|nr:DUF1993 domain-containing protein [Methylocella silvestris]ACK52263.1 conserved hypothetical protein [Methylocella silvestris BL2]
MTLSMYQASVPVFARTLGNLAKIMEKAEAYAAARKIHPSVLITDRLAPDMLPFSSQVQLAADTCVRGAARLAGVDFPSNPDVETTFGELQERLAKSAAFLKSLSEAQIDGGEERIVTLKLRDGEMTFTGQDFLLNFALPNFFFHVTAAYLILRHNGVDLGKMDYLGLR